MGRRSGGDNGKGPRRVIRSPINPIDFPEHCKIIRSKNDILAVGNFLTWMQSMRSRHIIFCEPHNINEETKVAEYHPRGKVFVPLDASAHSINSLICERFGLDEEKLRVEKEKFEKKYGKMGELGFGL